MNFENWFSGELSKIGHHFSNSKLKIDAIKKCAPKMVFFNGKKMREIWMIFDTELTLKIKFWHSLTPPHYTSSQNSVISFGYVDSYQMIFLFF